MIILVGFEGCISNNRHRLHLTTGESRNWKKYYQGCLEDTSNSSVINLLEGLSEHQILITTESPPEYSDLVERWLDANKVGYHMLITRQEKDFREYPFIVEEIIKTISVPVDFGIQSRSDLLDVFSKLRVPVFDPTTYTWLHYFEPENSPIKNAKAYKEPPKVKVEQKNEETIRWDIKSSATLKVKGIPFAALEQINNKWSFSTFDNKITFPVGEYSKIEDAIEKATELLNSKFGS